MAILQSSTWIGNLHLELWDLVENQRDGQCQSHGGTEDNSAYRPRTNVVMNVHLDPSLFKLEKPEIEILFLRSSGSSECASA
jgi:hypothetical protein